MEIRMETLSTIKLCRFCLTEDDTLTSIYDRNRGNQNSVPLTTKILSFLAIEAFPSDKKPIYVCNRCRFFMDLSYEYKQICRKSDENILHYTRNGVHLKSMLWPAPLKKLYDSVSKRSQGIKTVVRGKTTVQVLTQNASDSDDGEEDVYNIKIDNADPPSIKVTPSNEKADEALQSIQQKGYVSTVQVRHAPERLHQCKYCDKSFVIEAHYERHLRVKHSNAVSEAQQFRCEQCADSFAAQDDLIYHSAIHATQNLTCPLCQEKFGDVDAVTAHIKSHVNGVDIMCDFCELVFTSRAKLEQHIAAAHDDEMRNEQEEEESSDAEMPSEEEDNKINVKEEDDHMVVEIKKPNEFMLPELGDREADVEDKVIMENTNSEDSEMEAVAASAPKKIAEKEKPKIIEQITIKKPSPVDAADSGVSQPAGILRKAEEVKRKLITDSVIVKKEKLSGKPESNNSGGASDKSLRLLEKELQDLKRTNSRIEVIKPSSKSIEAARGRRSLIHTPPPKSKPIEEKKSTKSPVPEKKPPAVAERRAPHKDGKEARYNHAGAKDDKEKEPKDKDTPKAATKNGTPERGADDGVRRSTRPSKIKNYAKMIQDKTQNSDNEDDSYDEEDEEYKEALAPPEPRVKRRSSLKPVPKTAASPAAGVTPPAVGATPARKRGRPRKYPPTETPAKIAKKDDVEEDSKTEESDSESKPSKDDDEDTNDEQKIEKKVVNTVPKPAAVESEVKLPANIIRSPIPPNLKKVPIKALPPGVKPLPLSRAINSGEVCEMQIGKKLVKVQKIVMTKAELERMQKQGLVEMKEGTMVLKHGIKLPTGDPAAIKSTLIGDADVKESPPKQSDQMRP